jgi:hypothetical protein
LIPKTTKTTKESAREKAEKKATQEIKEMAGRLSADQSIIVITTIETKQKRNQFFNSIQITSIQFNFIFYFILNQNDRIQLNISFTLFTRIN